MAGKVMDGELVAINLQNGLYYSSNEVGAFIWEAIADGDNLDTIVRNITASCDVLSEDVAHDVRTFIAHLIEIGLLEPTGEATPPRNPVGRAPGFVTYAPPSLLAFDDMEQAFALDPPLRA
ncbi:MAG: PqqD family protein [Candidatus Sphingomonas phytovorans]|nr:PqqD family protein [Sphingomonas sp.]WEK00557.1 MAG: PqqD family protein [Sphingomonas sp.]